MSRFPTQYSPELLTVYFLCLCQGSTNQNSSNRLRGFQSDGAVLYASDQPSVKLFDACKGTGYPKYKASPSKAKYKRIKIQSDTLISGLQASLKAVEANAVDLLISSWAASDFLQPAVQRCKPPTEQCAMRPNLERAMRSFNFNDRIGYLMRWSNSFLQVSQIQKQPRAWSHTQLAKKCLWQYCHF